MAKKRIRCSQRHCDNIAGYRGLCEKHNAELEQEQREENEAVYLLHHGIITSTLKPIQDIELSKEFSEILKWWHRACDSENYGLPDPVLKDEAAFAVSWCIALTKALIKTDRDIAAGQGKGALLELEITRTWVWARFKNLEAGLMSNWGQTT